jgi:hypothetical protein
MGKERVKTRKTRQLHQAQQECAKRKNQEN